MTKTLGILGGLGPAASVYFYQLITEHTEARCDQDHLDIILISKASIPDRTDYILGKSEESPLPAMEAGVKKLAESGAQIIAIPCNTAHYFYDEIEKISPVPVLNIVKETVLLAKENGIRKLGIMATEGTLHAGAYQQACASLSMESVLPCESSRKILMNIIYNDIKTAKNPDMNAFLAVAAELYANGAEAIVLGCTELSLIRGLEAYPQFRFIDSLHVLAFRAIESCEKKPCGFPAIFGKRKYI
ncbi:MAG: aspartate/glutamate racemase family protein [Clostridia bacterium]|nr:aspartate/glutamate racemase family protein [Clostridia bacterium]